MTGRPADPGLCSKGGQESETLEMSSYRLRTLICRLGQLPGANRVGQVGL